MMTHPAYERGSMQEIASRFRNLSATMEDVYAISQSRYAWEAVEDLRDFFGSPIFMLMQIESPLWFDTEVIRGKVDRGAFYGMLVYLHRSLPREVLTYILQQHYTYCAPWLVSEYKSHHTQGMVRRMNTKIKDCVDFSHMGNLRDDILHSGHSPTRVCIKWGLFEAVAGERRCFHD